MAQPLLAHQPVEVHEGQKMGLAKGCSVPEVVGPGAGLGIHPGLHAAVEVKDEGLAGLVGISGAGVPNRRQLGPVPAQHPVEGGLVVVLATGALLVQQLETATANVKVAPAIKIDHQHATVEVGLLLFCGWKAEGPKILPEGGDQDILHGAENSAVEGMVVEGRGIAQAEGVCIEVKNTLSLN
jgi:hypothetical protein